MSTICCHSKKLNSGELLLLQVFITIFMVMITPFNVYGMMDYGKLTSAEEWVVNKLKKGDIADLAQFDQITPVALDTEFIKYLVVNQDLAKDIENGGIRIRNARFKRNLDLSGLNVKSNLWLEKCLFEKNVNLSNSSVAHTLSLNESSFLGNINLDYCNVGQNLELSGVIGKKVQIGASFVKKQCNIVDSSLTSVNLYNSDIGYSLHLNRTRFIGGLYLNSSHVSKDVIIRGVEANSAEIHNSVIDGVLLIGPSDKIVQSDTTASNIYAGDFEGGRYWKRRFTEKRDINIIGGNGLNLSGTRVGTFLMGPDSLPVRTDLRGFSYGDFLVLLEGGKCENLIFSTFKLSELLKKSPFSPQSYELLANILDRQGQKEKAKELRFMLKKEEHLRASGFDWIWKWILYVLVGYGLKPYYAAMWALFFIVLGASVFKKDPCVAELGGKFGISYSFDMLLPIVKLREKHYKIELLKAWRRHYLYFHKLVGYIIGVFLLAALTDLLK